jgi:hypothetical protein
VSVYSLSLSSGTTTTASPAFDLQGEGASPKILEVSVTCGSAAAGAAFGLGRAGNGVIWTFPRGLRVENGTSMVLWNILTNSPLFFATWIIDD